MSRLSNFFHHSSNHANHDNADSESQPSHKAQGKNVDFADGPAVESAELPDSDANGVLDKLKPKVREVIQEVLAEDSTSPTSVSKVDPISSLKKVPMLAKIAHALPEPLKNFIKDSIDNINKYRGYKGSDAENDSSANAAAPSNSESPHSPVPPPINNPETRPHNLICRPSFSAAPAQKPQPPNCLGELSGIGVGRTDEAVPSAEPSDANPGAAAPSH